MCTHRRLGSLFRNATYTQGLPDVFWTIPVTQNGVRLKVSITEHFSTCTTFWLRSGVSEMTFDSRGWRSQTRILLMRFKRSGLTGYATRSRSGSIIRTASVLVQLILTNQNALLGYMAESQLSLNIMNEFTDVPWDQKLRQASEASLAEHREKVEAET